jgi:2-dehydro-3-deoxygluconokinase
MTEVACIGECMVEFCERPGGLLSRGFGGDTLNTAIYLARSGVSVDYVSALGTDALSDSMIAAWREEGVGVEKVLRVEGALPGLYLIHTDSFGERRFSYWRESAPVRRLFDMPDFEAIAESLGNYRMIYLSGVTLSLFDARGRDALLRVLSRARAHGVKVAFDSNFRAGNWPDRAAARVAYAAVLQISDLVLASVEDFELLDERENNRPEDARSAAMTWLSPARERELVLRLPDLDCRVFTGGREARVPAEPVERVVDTTAAGDSFAAGYVAARMRGVAPEGAAAAGHRVARIVVVHSGAIAPREATLGIISGAKPDPKFEQSKRGPTRRNWHQATG